VVSDGAIAVVLGLALASGWSDWRQWLVTAAAVALLGAAGRWMLEDADGQD